MKPAIAVAQTLFAAKAAPTGCIGVRDSALAAKAAPTSLVGARGLAFAAKAAPAGPDSLGAFVGAALAANRNFAPRARMHSRLKALLQEFTSLHATSIVRAKREARLA